MEKFCLGKGHQEGKINLKRLYGEFNRDTISKMKERNIELNEEPYDLNKVMMYLENKDHRKEKQFEDRDAMKAEIFSEWLQKKGVDLL